MADNERIQWLKDSIWAAEQLAAQDLGDNRVVLEVEEVQKIVEQLERQDAEIERLRGELERIASTTMSMYPFMEHAANDMKRIARQALED